MEGKGADYTLFISAIASSRASTSDPEGVLVVNTTKTVRETIESPTNTARQHRVYKVHLRSAASMYNGIHNNSIFAFTWFK